MKKCWKKQPKKWPYCIRNTGNAEKREQCGTRACLNLDRALTALNADLCCCTYCQLPGAHPGRALAACQALFRALPHINPSIIHAVSLAKLRKLKASSP